MSYLQDKRLYYVNSAERLNPTTSSHSDFDMKLDVPENKFDSVVVTSLSVPKSYFLVDEKRNTFQLSEGTQTATITITAGNYSSSTFMRHCSQQLTTLSPNHWTYAITQNNQGKFEFTVTGNTSQPSIIVTTYLYEQLGFEPNTTNTFVNGKLTSTNVVDFQKESTLFLRSNIIGGTGDNVLASVFAENTTDFSNIVYNCTDIQAFSKPLVPNTGNIYHFWITNENHEKMDTNGRNLVFNLLLFKRSSVNENMNEFIKYVVKFIDDYKNKRI